MRTNVENKEDFLAAVDQRASSRSEIAKVLGLPPSRVSELFAGKRKLSFEEAVTLCRQYDIALGQPLAIPEAAVIFDLLTQEVSAGTEEQAEPDSNCNGSSDSMLDIAKRLRQRLQDLNLTQTQLARATGFSPARIANYVQLNERHNRTPDVRALIKLAEALRTTTDHILGLSEAPSDEWKEVVARVLELEEIEQAKAAKVVDVAEAALELLASLPPEGDPQTRAKLAAHAAWQMRASHSRVDD